MSGNKIFSLWFIRPQVFIPLGWLLRSRVVGQSLQHIHLLSTCWGFRAAASVHINCETGGLQCSRLYLGVAWHPQTHTQSMCTIHTWWHTHTESMSMTHMWWHTHTEHVYVTYVMAHIRDGILWYHSPFSNKQYHISHWWFFLLFLAVLLSSLRKFVSNLWPIFCSFTFIFLLLNI